MPTLYVVATPIGNLGDMSPRGIETLRKVACIAAEDTRVTQKLLNAFDIHTPLTSCHEHNERSKAAQLVQRMLDENIDMAVTTDAGTPCISDPGSILADLALEAGIRVLAVPGPTAMASALSVSGFPVEEFTFVGFLPREKKELKESLLSLAARSVLAVVHESPHRVADLLRVVAELLPHTIVSASCDLTKMYEKTLRGNVADVLQTIEENPKAEKGEYCIVFRWDKSDLPAEKPDCTLSLEAQLFDGLVRGLSLRESIEELKQRGEKKNDLYAASLHVKKLLEEGIG